VNKAETFSFVTRENISLNMNLQRAKSNRKNIVVIYFHGGGLLYGTRDDLPKPYVEQFLQAGYDFLAVDYLLAPEAKLDLILQSAFETLIFCQNDPKLSSLTSKYILFGRSAGAYLAFILCDMLLKTAAAPLALISLYGYARLDDPQFNTPSKYYSKLPVVSDESIRKIIAKTPVTYGPMDLRFSLYIKARQEGSWIKALCGNESPEKYSLSNEQLQNFPPTFLAAATLDPDVPYRISKTLSRLIPDSHLLTIYQEVHDFDRDTTNDSGRQTYSEILSWLEKKL